MTQFFTDSETYGTVDLKSRGLDNYRAAAESMIWTYARDDRPVKYWDVTSGASMPAEFEDNMLDGRVIKVAHNAPFDYNIARVTLGFDMPWESWWCTMSQAYAHSLPGSLALLGEVLGLPLDMQKLVEGGKLIQMFCKTAKGHLRKTAKTHPVEWSRFIDYAVQDTATLREVYKRLPKHNYSGEHFDLWVYDMEINERGFYIDQELCRAATHIKECMEEQNNAEIAELTGGAITKGTQRERVLHHVVGEYGELMLDLKADTIKKLLKQDDLDDDVRRLLELRRDSSLSSLAKYKTALQRVGPDGRMRYTLQFSAAGPGRWGGRGFQPQNQPRPKREAEEIENVIIPAIKNGTLPQIVDDVNNACKDAIRGTIIAAPGNELIVGDWSNIEGRCVAWEAGEAWKLAAFRANDAGTGPDLYNLLYSKLFRVAVEAVSKKDRQKGKVFELAFGYGGGVGACVTGAATYGVDLDELARVAIDVGPDKMYNKAEAAWKRAFIRGEDQKLEPAVYIGCDIAKQMYRATNPNMMQLWWDTERAVRWAIERPGSLHFAARCKIWCTEHFLIIELPSKRRLFYATPSVKQVVEYDEETEEIKARASIRYMSANKKQWRMERTYGGKLVENITQAIANDVLRAALLACRDEGWPVILHVHDEIVLETPEGFFELSDLLTLMERPLPWSEGLPLKAAGYTSKRYRKE